MNTAQAGESTGQSKRLDESSSTAAVRFGGRIEEALRLSRDQLAVILQGVTDGITAQDRTGRLIYANDAAARILGYPSARVLLETPLQEVMQKFEVLNESGDPFLIEQLPGRLVLEDERKPAAIIRFRVKATGEERWSDVKVRPIFNEQGVVEVVVNIFQDITGLKRVNTELEQRVMERTTELQATNTKLANQITERKQADDALRKNKVLFEGLFESAPDTIVLVNEEGRIVRLNKQIETMFGYSQAELLGKPVEILLPTRFRGRHVQYRATYDADPRVRPMGVGLELYGRHKSGSEFPVDITLSPLETEEGRLVIGVVRDISRRKQAAEAIRRANEFSDRLINSSLDGILAFDRECRYTVWNPGMERITGLSKTKVLGRCAFEVFPFLEKTGEDRHYFETLAGKATIARDRPYVISETGRTGFFEGYYSPIRDEAGEVVGGLAIIRDITERKQAEEALGASEARFRTVFERAGIGISLLDLEGRIIASNPAFQKMLGYRAEELHHLTFTDFTHPDDLEVSMDLFQALASGQRDLYRLEERYLRQDGGLVWGHLTASLIRHIEGQPQFIVNMIKNITERKQMEAELAEVQHRLMEGREAERLHLAQELHDGPLQDLYGASYQLNELWQALPDETSRGRLVAAQATVQRTVQTLRSLCGELRPPALAPFGLEKAIRSHAEAFQKTHPKLKVKLELRPDGHALPEQVRLALYRVYQQAMSNVIRHAQADHIRVQLVLNPAEVILAIEDDGRGFAMPARWVELARGGHLGLVGATERTEAIGGRLVVQSVPGKGTLIRAIVPCSYHQESDRVTGSRVAG